MTKANTCISNYVTLPHEHFALLLAYEDLSIAPEVEERLKATVSRAYLYSLMIYTRGGRVALQYGAKGLRGRQ